MTPTHQPARPRPAAAPAPWYRVGPVLALADGAAAGTDTDSTTSATTSTADVYVFDRIGGWWGMTAGDFVRDVAGLDVDQLVLHLNSPGGDAMEGVAIANVLRAHRARVVVRVDGLAASAASVIAMAGDEIVMSLGSQLMIHDSWTYAAGDAADLRKAAEVLDSTSNAMASTYAAKAGGTTAEWREAMVAETWYTAEEAVAAGLADRAATADETGTAEGEQVTPGASSSWWDMWDSLAAADRHDLSGFRYAGRDHAPPPAMPGRTSPAASAAGSTEHERGRAVAFSDEQLTTMRQRLGIAADADENTILAALERRPEPQLPEGVVAIEQATLDALRADAQAGRDAHDRQQREDRERLVDAAIGDGRIAPARREAWLAKLEVDPGEAETLASLEKGLIPVDRPRGHAERVDDAGEVPVANLQSGADLYNRRYSKKG